MNKKPISFVLFVITFIVLIMVALFAKYVTLGMDSLTYALLLVLILLIVFIFNIIGVIKGIKKKYEIQQDILLNRIGLFGNLFVIVCVFYSFYLVGF